MSGREAMLATVRAQLGYRERSDGSTKYGEWFADLVNDGAYRKGDWCAMGLLWSSAQTGQLDVMGGARREWAWVPSWWQHWRRTGRSTRTPAPGRIVFFDFNRTGEPEHVGICVRPRADGLIDTIEFNSGNACRERVRYPADILGYGDPAYADADAPADPVDDSCWIG